MQKKFFTFSDFNKRKCWIGDNYCLMLRFLNTSHIHSLIFKRVSVCLSFFLSPSLSCSHTHYSWGAIDFLHHKIGSTHVAHHFDSTIPHYKAQAATDAIKANFPEIYLYVPTPIPEALWRVCKGCAAVEKRGEYYIWDNKDVPEELLATE